MATATLLQSFLLLAIFSSADSLGPRSLQTGARRRDEPGVVNIHLVPHTHDDAGWLKTVDQYYYGANSSIQVAGVQYILDSVITSLQQNPHRKFIYGELSFFSRWWAEQSDATRGVVKALLANGQLSFVNGGYVQHDEATTHYVAMIDQTTRGHRWLRRELGLDPPRVGWQIDPFGHSRTHSSMFAKWGGIDAVFFGRIDHQDRAVRSAAKALEMVWEAGPSVGEDGNCFTGAFFSGSYVPPPGFHWEQGRLDEPMQDDPCLADYNVESRLAEFVALVDRVAAMHQGQDIMFTMGDDFNYMNANHWFKNLDKLIHHLNTHPQYSKKYNALYSNPEDYVAAKHSANLTWPTKADDFFPYADCDHCYWTGYFSSKAASKRYIRSATSYLQAARQLEAAVGRAEGGPDTDELEEAVSLLQHHDGITGTAKKHTVNDYHRRIAAGWATARQTVANGVEAMLRASVGRAYRRGSDPRAALRPNGLATPLPSSRASPLWLRGSQGRSGGSSEGAIVLGECPLLNVSSCDISVSRLSPGGSGVQVLLYNPLAWHRRTPVRVPLGPHGAVAVTDAEGKAVVSQIVSVSAVTLALQQQEAAGAEGHGSREVLFFADMRPLGFSAYLIKPVEEGHPGAAILSQARKIDASGDGSAVISNGALTLEFDATSGKMVRVVEPHAARSTALTQEFMFYQSSIGEEVEDHGQASGAYIFRPAGEGVITPEALELELVEGPLLSEARQTHSEWASTSHRLWANQSVIESEWTVGPIPVASGAGKEVVSRWTGDISSVDTLWTDANGREMMERKLNYRPTWTLDVKEAIAGNFYPVTAAAALRDAAGAELFVVTDRAQGAASLASGQMEFMVHRRTTKDDARGVAEPLDETTCTCHDCVCPTPARGLTVRGTHWVGLPSADDASRQRRTTQQLANDPPLLLFLDSLRLPEPAGVHLSATSLLADGMELPRNVALLTLMETEEGGMLLLRLAHLFELGEEGGEAACVDLAALFGNVASMKELSLTGLSTKNLATRRRWLTGRPPSRPLSALPTHLAECAAGEFSVVLHPMDIRTFELKLLDRATRGRSIN